MQRERRRNPYPWTWEPFALGGGVAFLVGLAMIHVSRGVANMIAGAGWSWPPASELFLSAFGVLGGDATAGLPTAPGEVAGEGLLMALVILGQVAWIAAAICATTIWWFRAGPGRIAGTATVEETQDVLGIRRLRADAATIRPDLYGRRRKEGFR